MNHTFTTKTWGGNKPIPMIITIFIIVLGIFLCLTIIGIPLGLLILMTVFTVSVFFMNTVCPSCEVKIHVFRNAKAYSCYNCQRVIVKKNNQWVRLSEEK